MNKYVIISDTTCDLPASYISENNIEIIPLCYSIDDVIYGDETDLTPSEFYDKMREGKMPTTMAGNQVTIEKLFRKYLDDGYDILNLAFSSALSSSYSTCVMVGKELQAEYPDRKIIVIDTLAASLGEGLIVYTANELKKSGKSLDEVAEYISAHLMNFTHRFTVDDLFHLHRGGRVSKTAAVLGTMINVKPILNVDSEGRLIPVSKVRGRKRALSSLVDDMAELIKGHEDENKTIFIGHGDCEDDANYVAKLVTEHFGYTDFVIDYICPTIGAHTGPGIVALFFIGEHR